MCAHRSQFDTFTTLNNPIAIEVADGKVIHAIAVGDIGILKDVYYVPQLRRNLISISTFDKKGYGILFENGHAYMRTHETADFQLVGVLDGALYESGTTYEHIHDSQIADACNDISEVACNMVEHVSDLDLWHQRLAHLSYDNVRHMHKKTAVRGMTVRDKSFSMDHVCDACARAKTTRQVPKLGLSSYRLPVEKKSHRSKIDVTAYFCEVNSDLIGPMQVQGMDGSRYAIHFTEARSRHRWLYTMKHKDETLVKIKDFISEIESQGFKLKLLKTDNGGEFVNDELKDYAKGNFTLRTTPPHTPESNATAERFNRILGERTRAMLRDKQLPLFFWPEAMKTITYLTNRTTTVSVGNHLKTPHELLFGIKPDISHLRVFGCRAYAYNFDPTRKKLDDKAKAGIFVGYDDSSAAYKVYLTNQRKIIKSGHVVFHERNQQDWGLQIQAEREQDWDLGLDRDNINLCPTTAAVETAPAEQRPAPEYIPNEADIQQLIDDGREAALLREEAPVMVTRGIKRDYRALHNGVALRAGGERTYSVRDTILHALKANKTELQEPLSYEEALQSEQCEEWQQAINSELLSIIQNEVWREVKPPANVKPLTTKWVFKIKTGPQGQIERFKGRLCVRGFEQELGIDFEEVFSPVMRHNSLRTLLSLAAVNDLEVKQMDVKTAFLHGELEEDVYIYAPKGAGYEPGTILKLNKSLYGLKQAPRVFNTVLNEHIVKSMGFKQCQTDPCVYTKMTTSGPVYLAVYVDDLIIVGKEISEIDKVKADLRKEFDMDDRGDAEYILGMQIERDRTARTLKLTQTQYAKDVVKKFNMDKSTCGIKVPIRPDMKMSAADCPTTPEEKAYMKKIPYRSAVGSLMYLATCTRPDISYAVSMCASYMHNPGRVHWKAVKDIMAYVNLTKGRGLIFGEIQEELKDTVYVFADADHAGNMDNRRSRTGYVTMFNGGAVSWKTRLQDRVGISSTEAEYYAASEAFGEAKWFRMLLAELNLQQEGPTVILEDNQSCINLSQNPVFQFRTKQIDIRHHQLREASKYKEIILQHIATSEQVADALTKGLEWKQFHKLTNECMMEWNEI